MTLPLAPLTELDAVNAILRVIGQSPVNTLSVDGLLDVSNARAELHDVSRTVQSIGWGWNTDDNFSLPRVAISNHIIVPATALQVDASDKALDIVQRYNNAAGSMCFYNRTDKTFTFEEDLEADITWFYAFEQLPQAARQYITIRAARALQAKTVGSRDVDGFTERDERDAWRLLQRAEQRTRDTNIFTGPDQTNRILFRRRYRVS
jgi:hypothetical protein